MVEWPVAAEGYDYTSAPDDWYEHHPEQSSPES